MALIPLFCITGPSVFKFELAVNPRDEVENFTVMLRINGVLVAQAIADDVSEPSNLALFYRGAIDDVSDVQVTVLADDPDFIDPKALQVGYKLYGPDYALLDEPDVSCL